MRGRLSNLASIVSVAFFLVSVVVYWARPGSARFLTIFGDSLPVLAAGFAAAGTLLVALAFDYRESHRRTWALIGVGLFLWFLGEVSWWIMEVALGKQVPFPSIADAFWLPGYIPLFAGLWLGFRQLGVRLETAAIVVSFGVLAAVLVAEVFLLLVSIMVSKISFVEKFLDLAYPIGDFFLLGPALLTLLVLRYGVLSRPWIMIAVGFVLMVGADSAFSYLSFFDVYKTGNPVDLVWVAGYLIIGVGSIWQMELLKP